jgi:hypothetical protein
MVGYVDDFKLMSIMALFLLPALLLMRPAKRTAKPDHDLMVE